MFFALVFAAPFVFLVSLVLAIFPALYGPRGVPYLLWLLLTGAGTMGAIAAGLSIKLMAIDGAVAQERLLHRQYAGWLDLRGYEDSEFPDPGQQWRYRLDDRTVAELQPLCRARRGYPPGDCSLYERSTDRSQALVTLTGHDLVIADLTI